MDNSGHEGVAKKPERVERTQAETEFSVQTANPQCPLLRPLTAGTRPGMVAALKSEWDMESKWDRGLLSPCSYPSHPDSALLFKATLGAPGRTQGLCHG